MPAQFGCRAMSYGVAAAPQTDSIVFVSNAAGNYERGRIDVIPDGFGDAEFTLLMWVRLTTGTSSDFADDTPEQRNDWTTRDTNPYSFATWWFRGNFLLDGHNNNAFFSGTFSVQFTGNGRVRWLFGDGAAADARVGDLHAVQASPSSGTASLLDGAWHRIGLVRRWDGGTGAILELWVDAAMVASETSTARTNMATTYWDSWTGYPANQNNWMFGCEKQSALGVISQWEDFKGNLSELSFWNRALSSGELADLSFVANSDSGLVGVYRFTEQTGTTAANALSASNNMTLTNSPAWSSAGPF